MKYFYETVFAKYLHNKSASKIFLGNNDLSCYFCNSNDHEHGECNSEEAGELIKCQYSDEKADHYGNACIVGHTGKLSLFDSHFVLCLTIKII